MLYWVRRIAYIGALVAGVLLLAGCGTDDQLIDERTEGYPKVYKALCLKCHGMDLEGRMGGNSNLQQVGSRLTMEQIADMIRYGGGAMPAFEGKLPDQDIQELAEWLSTYQ